MKRFPYYVVRRMNEAEKNMKQHEEEFICNPVDFDKSIWIGYFKGKTDCWIKEDEKLHFKVTIPSGYPLEPPRLVFENEEKVQNHPMFGEVVDSLTDGWSPAYTLDMLLISIYAILIDK